MRIENELTSNSIMKELGTRIKQYRIGMQMTQAELAKKVDISIRNIVRIEKGEDTQFKNIIKILSAFHLLNNLDLIIPDERQKLDNIIRFENNKIRNRASKTKKNKKFTWGDEKNN